MKKEITRLICAAICCAPIIGFAQTGDKFTSTDNLYKEGKELFQEKNYAAAIPALKAFVKQKPTASLLQDAEYMLVSSAYELNDKNRIELLRKYLDHYPDTPYANRIYSLLASCYFYEGKYDEAMALFNSTDLDLLNNEERDDRTYQLATCYLKTDNLREAAIWFETLRANSPKYAKDCDYYLSYIRYTQKRYNEALKGFLPLQDDSKYKALVPYYIAEIYAQLQNYDKAQIVAQNYLSAYPNNEHTAEMYRILGDAYYHFGQYHQAVESFNEYLDKDHSAPRRDALYMLGLSYYQTKVYSKAAETLGKVTTTNDALTQNAYLHMGLSYLQLAEKNKARMAFEQAAASSANMQIKEQAAYNYALCLHETSFSAFGESVTAFEKFLNEFPTSPYAEKVSSYLVEVYMNTRSYDAALKSIDGIRSVKVSFDFCYQYGSTDLLLFQVVNGGMIASASVDGKSIALTADNSGYTSASGRYIVEKSHVTLPSSEAAVKKWHNVEVVVNNATDGTMLYWAGNDVSSGVHGFYVDNIEVRALGEMGRGSDNLRVLYWNIQNGMWSDQANNYNNFVAWVKKYDPDICVWCESATIYKDNTNSAQASSARFLPDGWAALAARYGHAYTAVGGWRDNYPQTITSKYPIETLLKITDSDQAGKPVSHGAAIQRVTVKGRTINIVTLHTWPQAYGFGVGSADQAASAANKEGDKYREFEIKYICAQTVNNPAYASCQDWLMMGDFNSRSRADNWYYGYPENDTRLLVHNHILDHTDLKDIIAERYPGSFISSTYGNARIDYMYASPSMYARIVNALTVMDKWTTATQSPYVSNFYDPSDHRPILADFELKQ